MDLRQYLACENQTIAEFAKVIGVTPQAVHRYVSGDRLPHLRVMDRIRTATNGKVTMDDFAQAVSGRRSVDPVTCEAA